MFALSEAMAVGQSVKVFQSQTFTVVHVHMENVC
jgi:hypothetical protein